MHTEAVPVYTTDLVIRFVEDNDRFVHTQLTLNVFRIRCYHLFLHATPPIYVLKVYRRARKELLTEQGKKKDRSYIASPYVYGRYFTPCEIV